MGSAPAAAPAAASARAYTGSAAAHSAPLAARVVWAGRLSSLGAMAPLVRRGEGKALWRHVKPLWPNGLGACLRKAPACLSFSLLFWLAHPEPSVFASGHAGADHAPPHPRVGGGVVAAASGGT